MVSVETNELGSDGCETPERCRSKAYVVHDVIDTWEGQRPNAVPLRRRRKLKPLDHTKTSTQSVTERRDVYLVSSGAACGQSLPMDGKRSCPVEFAGWPYSHCTTTNDTYNKRSMVRVIANPVHNAATRYSGKRVLTPFLYTDAAKQQTSSDPVFWNHWASSTGFRTAKQGQKSAAAFAPADTHPLGKTFLCNTLC